MPIDSLLPALPRRLLVVLLLLVASQGQAFTLGQVQGVVSIGRPLDVAVAVDLDPNEAVSAACFAADVFQGDIRQDPSDVAVQLEPTALPSTRLVRVVSRSRIEEPIVTVYLRAGCQQMISRRYSLLAELPSAPAASPPSRVAAVPLVEPAATAGPTTGAATGAAGAAVAVDSPLQAGAASRTTNRASTGARTGAAQRVAPRQRAAVARSTRPAPPRAAASVRPVPAAGSNRASAAGRASERAPAASGPGAGQSRLRLDPLEQLSERVATLESSAATSPAQPGEREARDAERLDRLEASIKNLLVLAAKNEASLRDVRQQIEAGQSDRWNNALVTVLLGLLLLSLLAIVYLLTRMSRRQEDDGGRWFDARRQAERDAEPAAPAKAAPVSPARPAPVSPSRPGALAPSAAADSQPAPIARGDHRSGQPSDRPPSEPTRPLEQVARVPEAGLRSSQVDVSLVEMSESTFDRLMQSGAAHNAVRPSRDTVPMVTPHADSAAAPAASVAPSGGGAAGRRHIDADEMIDIRQRAEFFVTLGQTDQAVQVLETRIAQDAASCPQLQLDLLALFHALGLEADYEQLRAGLAGLFNVRVPDFADFALEGRVLEQYPGVMDRVIAAWRKPAVLDTLEQILYRNGPDAERFDLAAFRDLLLLHAVAQSARGSEAGRNTTGPDGSGSAVDIDLSELFAAQPVGVPPARDADAVPPPAPTLVGQATDILIDFDLSEEAGTGRPRQG